MEPQAYSSKPLATGSVCWGHTLAFVFRDLHHRLMELFTAATTLGKLLSTGYSLYQAVQGKGADFELDMKAYESLVELGGQLGNWFPKDAAAKDAAQALAVLTVAFGKSFHECFGAFHSFDDKARLQANLTAAVEWAQPIGQADSKKPPLSLPELLSDPEKTPYFASLWAAFTHRNIPGKAGRGEISNFPEPLIDRPSGDARIRFEQVFRRNVGELLSSPVGRDLSLAVLRVDGAAERARWVERLLVADMATWNQRHVFGNVRGHDTLPAMPLGKMYVEPNARLRKERGQYGTASSILASLRAALEKHSLVVVTADFGHGKSLTARTIAYQTAQSFRDNGSRPSADLERPIFVKCQTAFSTSSIELAQAVRRAQWLALKDELGIEELAESDDALSPPQKRQRTLFLLDGLDEVAFLERDCLHFFEKLRGQLTSLHRAIVFSRPHSLPTEKLAEWGVPVFELLPFDTDGADLGQAGQWLIRWNQCSGRSSIEPSALQTDGLVDLARTPILLFMMAYTWGDLKALYADWQPPESEHGRQEDANATPRDSFAEQEAIWDRKHRIYEAFFRAIAWGKYERDRDGHPAIKKAASALREALDARSMLDAVTPNHSRTIADTERERLLPAMLWLMGRVAWRSRCLQQEPKPKTLTRSQVERLLEDELDIDDPKVTEVVRDGLLLAMQADLSESSRPILFGHQSFREFLVARCWSELLRVLVDPQTEAEQKTGLIIILRDGQLREGDDRSFDFLRARLRQWSGTDRERLYEWSLAEFMNDAIEKQQPTLRSDTRRDFRCTALALASTVASKSGLVLGNHSCLRSLLASYWIAEETCSVWAVRLQANSLNAPGVQIRGANLFGANLSGANLSGANLSGANLLDADLTEATLARANLSEANLSGANLAGATLSDATLYSANLSGVNLSGATLSGANLYGANLASANLSGANLSDAKLDRAILTKAKLDGAKLYGANLSGAFLYGAKLNGANLSGANLHRAQLDEAKLNGAKLYGAVLDEDGYQIAVANGAIVDETTRVTTRSFRKEV